MDSVRVRACVRACVCVCVCVEGGGGVRGRGCRCACVVSGRPVGRAGAALPPSGGPPAGRRTGGPAGRRTGVQACVACVRACVRVCVLAYRCVYVCERACVRALVRARRARVFIVSVASCLSRLSSLSYSVVKKVKGICPSA
jgi:hypothetical protein